jgi:hypothetical protein
MNAGTIARERAVYCTPLASVPNSWATLEEEKLVGASPKGSPLNGTNSIGSFDQGAGGDSSRRAATRCQSIPPQVMPQNRSHLGTNAAKERLRSMYSGIGCAQCSSTITNFLTGPQHTFHEQFALSIHHGYRDCGLMDVHADVLFLTHKRSLSRGWRSEQSQPLAKVGAFSYCLQWVVTSPTLGSTCKQSARGAEAAITGLSGCVPEAASTVHVADQSYRGVGCRNSFHQLFTSDQTPPAAVGSKQS